jgi:FkbM family methyltransferase
VKFMADKLKDSEYHFTTQRLRTGHVAPFDDNDIFQNVELSGLFPHGPIVTGCAHFDGVPELAAMPKGSVVIDVGAFIGDNTVEFVSYGWKVVAFEPFLDAYTCLCKNSPASINIMAPVGNGESVVLDSSCPGTNHGMRTVKVNESGIPTVRIDDLPIAKPDFIKIDCEGHECFVLQCAINTIRNHRPYLYVECFPERMATGCTREVLAKFMDSVGSKFREIGSPPKTDWFCFPEEKLM